MTAVPLQSPYCQFYDNNGDPLNGGKIYSYVAGSGMTTPQDTYTSYTGLTPNTNPVVLDSSGRAEIWIVGSYGFEVKTSTGTLIRSVDNITALNKNGDMTAAVYDPAGIGQQLVGTSASQTITNKTIGVASMGTGASSFTAYAPVVGGTTSTGALQSTASAGTSGQFLTSAGAAAKPVFSDRGTVIASGSFPAAATLDVIDIPTTYAHLGIFFNGASSDTATRELQIRASVDNGSSFSSTAADYRGTKIQDTTVTNKARATLIETATSAAAVTKTGSVMIFGYQDFTFPQFQSFANDGTIMWSNIGQLVLTGVNAIRFQWDGSGNFDAGSYIVVGF